MVVGGSAKESELFDASDGRRKRLTLMNRRMFRRFGKRREASVRSDLTSVDFSVLVTTLAGFVSLRTVFHQGSEEKNVKAL